MSNYDPLLDDESQGISKTKVKIVLWLILGVLVMATGGQRPSGAAIQVKFTLFMN